MTNHNFNFSGGYKLRRITATWFVAYLYFLTCDTNFLNWQLVKTYNDRIAKFNNSKKYHKHWLEQIIDMNCSNLTKTTILVSPMQTKKMAARLLFKCSTGSRKIKYFFLWLKMSFCHFLKIEI